jgi:hypothetical protein
MKIWMYSQALLLLAATSAAAQVEPGFFDRFQTRFGLVEVVGPENQRTIAVNGQVLPLETNFSYNILGAWGLADAGQDWVFVQGHHGGNMCGPGLTVLRVSAATIEVLGTLEDCTGFPFETRVYPDAIELDVYDSGLQVDYTTYLFDGAGASRLEVAGVFAAPVAAGPGADALRWVGTHPYDMFRDASERARFLAIMSEDQIRDFAVRFGPADNVIQRGDWVLGAGCQAHACNLAGGVWGIRISDGAAAAAALNEGQPPDAYGAAALDPVFSAWVGESGL